MTDIYRKYDDKSQEWGDFGDLKARQDIGIVEDTDVAEHTIASGQYVIWKGNLYTANSAIAIGTGLTTSNLTAVNNGGFNKLNSKIDEVRSNTKLVSNGGTGLTSVAIGTESYNSLLEVINQYKSIVNFPISITKISNKSWSDLPSGHATNEFNFCIFGTPARLTVIAVQYGGTYRGMRHMFNGSWLTDWFAF